MLVSGGSAANLTALACAREARIGAMDEQAVAVHVRPDALVAGARRARARLPARPGARDPDRPSRPDPAGCARAPRSRPTSARGRAAARRRSRTPAPPPPGAIDPLRELAEICREHGVWLHVDGAYGAFACLTERGRQALAGMELADSIALDPHKWLYQPVELGALLVRDGGAAAARLRDHPRLPQGRRGGDHEVNFSDLGLQLTRSCRGAEALDVAPLLRRRRVPRRRSTAASTSRRTRSGGSRPRPSSS